MKNYFLTILTLITITNFSYSQINDGDQVCVIRSATGQTFCSNVENSILLTICVGEELCFPMPKTDAINTWDVIDGSSCNPPIVQSGANTFCCTYNTPGTFNLHYIKVQYDTGYNNILWTQPSPTVKVIVLPRPTLVMYPSLTICSGESALIGATGASTYLWNNGNINPNYYVSPTTTTTYTVTGTTNGCSSTGTITVTVKPKPTVTVNSPSFCSIQPAILTGAGATTYLWSNGQTINPITVNPSSTTSYTVTGTTNGCTNSAIATVSINSTPTVTVNSPSICKGSNATLTANGATSYSWSTGQTTNPITVFPITTTSYTVTGTTNGCTNTAISTVTVNSISATASATPSGISSGQTSALNATPNGGTGYTYSWLPSGTLSNSTIQNPIASPTVTTTYTVTITDSRGCTTTATTTVTVAPPQCLVSAHYTVPTTGANASDILSFFGILNQKVIAKNIFVQGTLTIDTYIEFNTCNIIMAPNTKIELTSGNLKLAEETHMYSCSNLWDGIYIPNGRKLTIANAFIEDANNAVVSVNGGEYDIDRALFNKNFKAIDVRIFQTAVHPGVVKNSIFTSRNIPSVAAAMSNPDVASIKLSNSLTTYPSSNLKAPGNVCKSGFGVYATDVILFQIGLDDSPTSTNVFDNILCGIRAKNSTLLVYNNQFQNLLGNAVISCTSGSIYCEQESGIGVLTSSTTGNEAIQVGGTGLQINTFSNCYQALNSKNYTQTSFVGNTVLNSSVGPFSSLPPAIGYGHAGVYIQPAVSGNIAVSYNTITNCKDAIWINRTGTGINSNEITISYNTITANTSGYCTNGVNFSDVTNTGSTTPVDKIKIEYNSITQAYNCITATNVKNSLVIRSNTQLQTRNNGTTATNAIRIQNCKGVKIHDNQNINISPVPSPVNTANVNFKGIFVTTSTENQITCNKISNMGESMTFVGSCINSTLRNNTLNKGNRGFVLRTNGEVGAQGTASLPCGLWWESNASSFTAHTYTDGTINANANSKLFVNGTGAPAGFIGVPTANFGSNPLFYYSFPALGLNNATGSPISCGTIIIQMAPVNGDGTSAISSTTTTNETALLTSLATDESAYPVYGEEHQYSHKKYAFDKLEANGEINNATLQNFYDSVQVETMGKLKQVDNALKLNDAALASALNSSLFANNVVENNQKAFNALYLNYLNNNEYVLTQTEKDELLAIAEQCPLEGGSAVWQARVLYSTIENEWIEFADNCNTTVRQMTLENTPTTITQLDTRFKLYPNPNNGQMVLEYTLEDTANAVLAIYDLTGKEINSYMINSKNRSLQVNEDQLEAGIYLYQIKVNDKLVKKDKLVIIK